MPIFRMSAIFASLLLLLAACSSSSDDAVGDSGSADATNQQPAPVIDYSGPAFQFQVTLESSATQFRWSVIVPTGGWQLKFDGSRSSPKEKHAIIEATLFKPEPGEIVTQALETLEDDYRHGRMAFETAEFMVRLVVRGEAEDSAEYRRAAYWSAE